MRDPGRPPPRIAPSRTRSYCAGCRRKWLAFARLAGILRRYVPIFAQLRNRLTEGEIMSAVVSVVETTADGI